MRICRVIFHAFATLLLAAPIVCAQAPWIDARYMNRVSFTVSNASGRSMSAGDVVSVALPATLIDGRLKADGSDAVVEYGGALLPSRALPMGGTVKVLLPLQSSLANGASQSGYTLYFNALQNVAPPALPPGVQGWDFGDGEMHGWKSLQDPNGSSDVKTAPDSTYGNALTMDNSRYHHPIAYAAGMDAQGDGTTYTKLRTGGGENEAATFQRFNTQMLIDLTDADYLTGANTAGTGMAVDSFGSQQMMITVGLGGAEGTEGRRHPGPGALDPGAGYAASADNFQYMITATQQNGWQTYVLGDAWQAPVNSPGGAGDPTATGFQLSRSTVSHEPNQPLPAGKVGIMSYYSTLRLHWLYAVPNPWAEYTTTSTGAVETASGPGPGKAIVQGFTYYQPNGESARLGGLTITVYDSLGSVIAANTGGANGAYQFLLDAGPASRKVTISITGNGILGSAVPEFVENTTNTVNIPVNFTNSVTGTVYDANGSPVAGAAVGRPLDGLPWVFTSANGKYALPVPGGTAVVGAHEDGMYLSGPKWITGTTADFTLLPASTDILQGITPVVVPSVLSGDNLLAMTDGNLSTAWTSGSPAEITPANPLRITFTTSNATVNEIDVQWKRFPAAWRLEMTNSGGTRTYYSAGETTAFETGGYLAPGTADRHVVPIKTAVVRGVTSISLVISDPGGADPLSLYEIIARPEHTTTISDAATAMRIATGLQQAPKDLNAFYRWNAFNDDAKIDLLDAIEIVKDMNREVKPLRVFVINYVPVIEAEGNRTVGQIFGWNNPYTNTENHRKDMELGSHDYLRIYLLPQVTVDEYPVFDNGYQFTDATFTQAWRTRTFPPGHCNENEIIRKFDLVRRVNCGDIDEIWVQAVPGFAMWETTMAGPGAYWCNSGPVSGTNGNRLFIMTFFNYERENDVMLEDWGHRIESILGFKVYGNWDSASERTTWDKFTRYDKITPGKASCGNVHFPPNGTSDYDFANTTYVSSDADDWLNYPSLTGARKSINRSSWATPFAGDYHRNYHIWWFQRLPHVPGMGPDGYQANWWKYIVDMNSYPESR